MEMEEEAAEAPAEAAEGGMRQSDCYWQRRFAEVSAIRGGAGVGFVPMEGLSCWI